MDNVIDLRKLPELPPPAENPPSLQKDYEPKTTYNLLSWTASEYEIQTYSFRWFFIAGGIALVFILIAIITQNYFFLALVALAFFVTIMYVTRKPRIITFAIANEGIYIGHTVFLWKSIKSFWIIERTNRRELSLETDKILTPYVRIPLSNLDITRVRELLKKFIPEREHQELVTDEIGRNLGF